jgi:hypothetical protein
MTPTTHRLRNVVAATMAVLASAIVASAQQAALPPPPAGIGYPTVAAAFQALRHKSGVKISNPLGWTVIEDKSKAGFILWSFVPQGHPAYPAVVRRQIVQNAGGIYVAMNVLCEAPKLPCDKLVAEFKALNTKVREDMKRREMLTR